MKIISLIVFLAAIIGTWHFSHRALAVPESIHVDIQNELKQIIADYVHKQLPTSKNVVFTRFWTQTVNPTKVKASFAYSFDDDGKNGPTTVDINGYAILNKSKEDANSEEWSFDELHISDSGVDFQQPLTITTSPKGAEK